ncbi:NUDIX hydrolase [Horticoccus sp. 23ND18S-11]|uniref:NUDIX hydrolase n=1 Tax=Horticoccus sp. 23ND18S-11 TaxID=3391832 RepID=UPI0039C91EAF
MSSDSPQPSRWEKLGQRSQLQTRVFEVRGTRYRHPVRLTEREFVVIHAPDWVNVVAVTTDERIVLVRQFRYGIDEFSLEVPGGVMEAGEDPVTAGLRELREETGFHGASARLLGNVHPNPAIQANRCHFVLVEGAERAHELEWDTDEELQVTTPTVAEVLALAHAGAIVHGLALNALMMFEQVWRERGGSR